MGGRCGISAMTSCAVRWVSLFDFLLLGSRSLVDAVRVEEQEQFGMVWNCLCLILMVCFRRPLCWSSLS